MAGCKKMLRDARGSTVVEFALIMPVLLLVIFGTIEFSLILFAKSVMEGAVSITSRMGKTGYEEEGKSRKDMLVELMEQKSSGLFDPDKVTIETLVYESFADINKPEPLTFDKNGNGQYDAADGDTYVDLNSNGAWDNDLGSAGLGGAGDIVVYTVHYPWPILTPVMRQFLGNEDGEYPLEASAVVRNEPYNDEE